MGAVFMESPRKSKLIRITVWAAALGLLLGVLSSLAMAGSADAHAVLRSISPKDGARLTSAPTEVVLTFNEPVSSSFATVTVTATDGAPRDSGNALGRAVHGHPAAGCRPPRRGLLGDLPRGVRRRPPDLGTTAFTVAAPPSTATGATRDVGPDHPGRGSLQHLWRDRAIDYCRRRFRRR